MKLKIAQNAVSKRQHECKKKKKKVLTVMVGRSGAGAEKFS